MNRWLDVWNHFWFDSVSAESLGIMRLTLGLILLFNHIHLWFFWDVLLATDGAVPVSAVVDGLSGPRLSYKDDLSNVSLQWVHGIEVAVFMGLTLGWKSRWMAWFALLIQASIYHRNPWMQNGGDRVMRLGTLYLALVPCGLAFSLDAKKSAQTQGESIRMVPVLGHRLLQLQWMLIYAQSGWEKAKGSAWWDGSALYDALSVGGYQRWPAMSEWLLNQAWFQAFCMLGTWVTLIWEMGFALMVLWRPTRWIALSLGVVIHWGIFSGMMVGAFSFIMLWGYQAWLPPDWPQRMTRWWNERRYGST